MYLPNLRKVMPSIIADDIVGVQPMSMPSGLIFSMKHRYNIPVQFISYETDGEFFVKVVNIRNDLALQEKLIDYIGVTPNMWSYFANDNMIITFTEEKYRTLFLLQWAR